MSGVGRGSGKADSRGEKGGVSDCAVMWAWNKMEWVSREGCEEGGVGGEAGVGVTAAERSHRVCSEAGEGTGV